MSTFRERPDDKSTGARRRGAAPNHVVHFYDEQEALVQSAASFLAGGLLRGAPAIVIIAPNRSEAMKAKLRERGVDVPRALTAKQLALLDSAEMVSRLLVDGMPDAQRFRELIGAQVASMMEIWRPFQLLAFGDMVDILYTRGDVDAAIELERLWNDLAHQLGFALYCAYDATQFSHDRHRAAFETICNQHDLIVPVHPTDAASRPLQA